MLNLNTNKKSIEDFIQTSIDRFVKENQLPNSVGIYCCPWAGWLSTNFNAKRTIKEVENNCPDFEYVQFGCLALPKWEEEYETDNPQYKLGDSIIQHDHDSGDESLNQLIFEYLKPIVIELKLKYDFDFLLQMLDSDKVEVF